MRFLGGLSPAASGYLMAAGGAAFMDRVGEAFVGREMLRSEIMVLAGSSRLAGAGLILVGLARLGAPLAETTGLHVALMGGLGVLVVFSIAGLLHCGRLLAFTRTTRLAALPLVVAVAFCEYRSQNSWAVRKAVRTPKGKTMTIPTYIPDGFEAYGRSPEFTPETLPAKLQSAHSTKTGTWALLHVIEGEVLFQLEQPYQGERRARGGETIVIEDAVPHHVAFTKPGRIFIEFYRKRKSDIA